MGRLQDECVQLDQIPQESNEEPLGTGCIRYACISYTALLAPLPPAGFDMIDGL